MCTPKRSVICRGWREPMLLPNRFANSYHVFMVLIQGRKMHLRSHSYSQPSLPNPLSTEIRTIANKHVTRNINEKHLSYRRAPQRSDKLSQLACTLVRQRHRFIAWVLQSFRAPVMIFGGRMKFCSKKLIDTHLLKKYEEICTILRTSTIR